MSELDVHVPDFAPAPEPAPEPGRFKVFAYLTAPHAERYVQIMELFVTHKRRFGLRLAPRELLVMWQDVAPDSAPTVDELVVALEQLYEWEAVDRQADTGRAGSTAEFKRARNTYDITAAGEASWEAAQRVLTLERRVASLGQQRLRRIAGTLDELAQLSQTSPVDGQRAEQLLVTLRAEIADTVQGISAFMRELGEVMTLGERLEREPFLAYKARVVDHLQHFDPMQRESHARFTVAARTVEEHLDALVAAVVAAGGQVAGYRQAPEQADRIRAEAVREEWRQAHDWLVGRGETTPWEQLRRSINGAVDWLLDTWNRLASEQSGRLDRSSDYRRLAAMLVEDPDSGPELFHLAFAMSPARHLSVPDPDEDQLENGATQSWWTVPGLLMDRTLRLPSSRTNQGRTTRIPDVTQARQLARVEAEEDARADAALRTRLLALHGKRLSEFHILDEETIAAIDEWIMECGTRATSIEDPGPWRHVDAGRELTVELTPQPGRARLRTAAGEWELDDLKLEVKPA
ncbi:TIGR02677 family protein [Solirubrobacter phytolaccae]|uniref:TIGR02677 family protein n=1 Tax=Solirubrobacter phytolaccae TaxID=1404360 RepID=A0A9X3SA61_9ACTN|nr:TIGR02677 family protein [Solirubrobacter phytolaccae]MDA0183303.1 TIGR02677 family protein [Solirubrobacter phytolaccae]